MGEVCTFFGHHDCPDSIKPKLKNEIVRMIEERNVDCFYVGNQGSFDAMVRLLLKEMNAKYPHIRYSVVLAYMPGKKNAFEDYSDTLLPDGIETVPRSFAISWRKNGCCGRQIM